MATQIKKENQGKIAFITGANRGIGLETARELGEKGVTVLLGSRDVKAGEAEAKKLREAGSDVIAVQFDINKLEDHERVAKEIEKRFGHLDILINNAGIATDLSGEVKTSQTNREDLQTTFNTNFFNLISLTQTLLPLVRKAPAGRIVNLSSILGSLTLHSDPHSPIYDFKAFAYNASKSALNAFTVHLAHELKDTKIKVNSAHPGWVKTALGGPNAPMELSEGGRTSVQLALLNDNGPTGGFFHNGDALPW